MQPRRQAGRALPVLPRISIGAHHRTDLTAVAGGDWFATAVRADGSVVLAIGDIVGAGMAATTARTRFREVLLELLTAEPDLDRMLQRVAAYLGDQAPPCGTTSLCLAVVEPDTGVVRHASCGHPPPLVLGALRPPRFLPLPASGRLGAAPAPRWCSDRLAPGEVLVLVCDRLATRLQGAGDGRLVALELLARRAADGAVDEAATLASGVGGETTLVEHICRSIAGVLGVGATRDHVTVLAAQRLLRAPWTLRLEVPDARARLSESRSTLRAWLDSVHASRHDRRTIDLAVTEALTGASVPSLLGEETAVSLQAELHDDGVVECHVAGPGTQPTVILRHRLTRMPLPTAGAATRATTAWGVPR